MVKTWGLDARDMSSNPDEKIIYWSDRRNYDGS